MEKSTWKQRLAIGVLCVCILSYTVYHLASLFGERLSTFAAGVITETESVSGSGYVFRDETVLYSQNGGVVDYRCADGTKVTEGQPLADVYESGRSADRRQVSVLDHQIAVLEKSMTTSMDDGDISALKQTINDQYYLLAKMLSSEDTGELSLRVDEMLVAMNRLNVEIDADQSPVATTLSELKAQKDALLQSGGSAVTESASGVGYFYTDVDGYETVFTEEALASLTPTSFSRMIQTPRPQADPAQGTAYGKLAADSTWGFVIEVPKRQAESFVQGAVYSIQFTENNATSLPMTLERTMELADRGSILLIFSCDRLPTDFSFGRRQSVRIETDRVSGLYVPMRAVKYVNDFAGVYVLRGSVVYFRYIDIIYEGSDYYLVAERTDDTGTIRYLAANDLIILNGNNLFDGRVLE